MTTVINIRHGRAVLKEPDVVRIDRATKWGNPFVIGRDGDRARVIARSAPTTSASTNSRPCSASA